MKDMAKRLHMKNSLIKEWFITFNANAAKFNQKVFKSLEDMASKESAQTTNFHTLKSTINNHFYQL